MADMKLVRTNPTDVAFEETVAGGQIASTAVTKFFQGLFPLLHRAGEIDDRKYVNFIFRG